MAGIVTVVLSGIPPEIWQQGLVRLEELAHLVNEEFGSEEIGTFRLREVRNKVVIDFNNGYDAMTAQNLLDRKTFTLNGAQQVLRARVTHDPAFMTAEPLPPAADYSDDPHTEAIKRTNTKIEAELRLLKIEKKCMEKKENILEREKKRNEERLKMLSPKKKMKKAKKRKRKKKESSSSSDSSDPSDDSSDSHHASPAKRRRRDKRGGRRALRSRTHRPSSAGAAGDAPRARPGPSRATPDRPRSGRARSRHARSRSRCARSRSRPARSQSRRARSRSRRARSRSKLDRSHSRPRSSRRRPDRSRSRPGPSRPRPERSWSRQRSRSRQKSRSSQRSGSRQRSRSSQRSRSRSSLSPYKPRRCSSDWSPSRPGPSRSRPGRSRSRQRRSRTRERYSSSPSDLRHCLRNKRRSASSESAAAAAARAIEYRPNVSEQREPPPHLERPGAEIARSITVEPAYHRVRRALEDAMRTAAAKDILLELEAPLSRLVTRRGVSQERRARVLQAMVQRVATRLARLRARSRDALVLHYRCNHSRLEDEAELEALLDDVTPEQSTPEASDLLLQQIDPTVQEEEDEDSEERPRPRPRNINITIMPIKSETSKERGPPSAAKCDVIVLQPTIETVDLSDDDVERKIKTEIDDDCVFILDDIPVEPTPSNTSNTNLNNIDCKTNSIKVGTNQIESKIKESFPVGQQATAPTKTNNHGTNPTAKSETGPIKSEINTNKSATNATLKNGTNPIIKVEKIPIKTEINTSVKEETNPIKSEIKTIKSEINATAKTEPNVATKTKTNAAIKTEKNVAIKTEKNEAIKTEKIQMENEEPNTADKATSAKSAKNVVSLETGDVKGKPKDYPKQEQNSDHIVVSDDENIEAVVKEEKTEDCICISDDSDSTIKLESDDPVPSEIAIRNGHVTNHGETKVKIVNKTETVKEPKSGSEIKHTSGTGSKSDTGIGKTDFNSELLKAQVVETNADVNVKSANVTKAASSAGDVTDMAPVPAAGGAGHVASGAGVKAPCAGVMAPGAGVLAPGAVDAALTAVDIGIDDNVEESVESIARYLENM